MIKIEHMLARAANHALFVPVDDGAPTIQLIFSDRDDETWHLLPNADCYKPIRGAALAPQAILRTTVHAFDLLTQQGATENLSHLDISGDRPAFVSFARNVTARRDRWLAAYASVEAHARETPVTAIARLRSPRAAVIAECLRISQPAILTEMMEQWPIRHRSLSEIADRFAHVPLMPNKNSISVGEMISQIRNGTSRGTGGGPLPAPIRNEIRHPLADDASASCSFLFLGARNAVTPLHRDLGHGMNAQVVGRKSWILFSPDQTPFVYPCADHRFIGYQECEISADRPDLDSYPNFARARPLSVIVHPGEIMLLPSGWYHEVHLLDPALSIAFPIPHQ